MCYSASVLRGSVLPLHGHGVASSMGYWGFAFHGYAVAVRSKWDLHSLVYIMSRDWTDLSAGL